MPANSKARPKTSQGQNLTNLRKAIAGRIPLPTWTIADLAEKPQIERLWAATQDDTGHPLLVHFLSKLIDIANVPARDPIKLARAIQLYSARRIKFFRERPERFQSAIRTVVWGIGDCDDKARFIAASLRTFRIPVRLKFLYMTLPDGKQLGHVYPQAWLPFQGKPQWVALESVREYPMGYDPEQTMRDKGYPVRVDYLGDPPDIAPHI